MNNTENLSEKWAKTFLEVLDSPHKEITPYIFEMSISNNEVLENVQIKTLLNNSLEKHSLYGINTVANTIFPSSYWDPSAPRQDLFDKFKKNWPKIKEDSYNRNGTYFQRMIMYNKVHNEKEETNQLEDNIQTWKDGTRRRSAFQIAIHDPRMDHIKTPYQIFPCLQQISIVPQGVNGNKGIAIVGYYATQTVFEKAYGNYLGLCKLGLFLANEMQLNFTKMICFASVLILSSSDKNKICKNLGKKLEEIIK